MEIGVRLLASGPYADPETITTVAQWAEQLGYHSVWLGEHVLYPERIDSSYPYAVDNRWTSRNDTRMLDPILALAWAAAAAPSIKIGTSVYILPLRNPILLAKQLSTLDFLSKGRVIFGAGVGWMEEEFDLVGAPFARRGKRADEMVALMRELWTGEAVDFQGEFWQVSNCRMHPTPAQGQIPVLWGGHSDPALRRVARLGDGWQPTQITMEQLVDGIARLRAFCDEYGRDFSSLTIVDRPGPVHPVDAEILTQCAGLGVQQVIVDPPMPGPDLRNYYESMQQIAETCGLQPREN